MSSKSNLTTADPNNWDITLVSAGMHRNQVSPEQIRVREEAGQCLIELYQAYNATHLSVAIPPVYPSNGSSRGENFQRHLDHDGQWRVVDIRTGRTAELGSRQVSGLNKCDAVEMVEIFNAPPGSLS